MMSLPASIIALDLYHATCHFFEPVLPAVIISNNERLTRHEVTEVFFPSIASKSINYVPILCSYCCSLANIVCSFIFLGLGAAHSCHHEVLFCYGSICF